MQALVKPETNFIVEGNSNGKVLWKSSFCALQGFSFGNGVALVAVQLKCCEPTVQSD